MRTVEQLGEIEAALAIDTIRTELVRRGKAAVIAVCDGYGEPISLVRMDGAPASSVRIAASKCLTAARERTPTGELGKSFREAGWQMANSDPRYTGWGGGIPVRHRGEVVGAVAVSGLTEDEDAELARIGVARIAEVTGP